MVNNKIKMKLDRYGEYHPIVEAGAKECLNNYV